LESLQGLFAEIEGEGRAKQSRGAVRIGRMERKRTKSLAKRRSCSTTMTDHEAEH